MSVYFPDVVHFNISDLPILAGQEIIVDISFNLDVTIAVIRPPECATIFLFQSFPNLKYVISDTTGISHLLVCSDYPEVQVFTLRDVSNFSRVSLTAACDLAFLLIQLSLRPVLAAYSDYLSQYEVPSQPSLLRADYIGRTFNDTKFGILGFGRIGNCLLAKFPRYTQSIYIYDNDASLLARASSYTSDMTNVSIVSSLEDLLCVSDVLVICITDDPKLNQSFVNLSSYPDLSLHSIVNISRDYVVDFNSIVSSLHSCQLGSYYSDFLHTNIPFSHKSVRPFIESGRMLLLPHMGGCTYHSWTTSLNFLLEHCKSFFLHNND